MKATTAVIGIVLATVAQGAELPAGADTSKNYVRNGSFELGRDNFDYDGWQNTDRTGWSFSITNCAAAGKRALFVEKSEGRLIQNGLVETGTYVLTVTVRANPGTEHKEEKGRPSVGFGMNYCFNYRTEKDGKQSSIRGVLFAGCAKDAPARWERLVSQPIKLPANAYGKVYFYFELGAFNQTPGSGIIDDVGLYKVRSDK